MQMHCYIPDAQAEAIQRRAAERGISVSRYLAELVLREVGKGWPEGFFEAVVGKWQGELPERPDQGEFEVRAPF